MGRKRKGIPERLDPTKQQRLVWSMADMMAANRDFINDNQQGEGTTSQNGQLSTDDGTRPTSHRMDKRQLEAEGIAKRDAAINECDFYLEINQNSSPATSDSWCCHLGTFYITIHEPNSGSHCELPETLDPETELWFYVNSDNPQRHLVYLESTSESSEGMLELGDSWVMFFQARCDISPSILKALKSCNKLMPLNLNNYDPASGSLQVNVLATEGILTQLQFSNDSPRLKRVHTALQEILSQTHGFTPIEYLNSVKTEKHDTNEFYRAIREEHQKDDITVNINVQHPNLRPRLRQYQKEAVMWMLQKEGVNASKNTKEEDWTDKLYEEIHTMDKQTLFFNRHTGFLLREKPQPSCNPPGGILADEMGLGKTVEVLACMMCHPRPDLPPIDPLPVIIPQPPEDEDLEEETHEDNESEADNKTTKKDRDITKSKSRRKRKSKQASCSSGVKDENHMEGKAEEEGEDTQLLPESIALDHDYCEVKNCLVKENHKAGECGMNMIEKEIEIKGKGKTGSGKGKSSGRNKAKNGKSCQKDAKTPGKSPRSKKASTGGKNKQSEPQETIPDSVQTKLDESKETDLKIEETTCENEKEQPKEHDTHDENSVKSENQQTKEPQAQENKDIKTSPEEKIEENSPIATPEEQKKKKPRRRVGYVDIVEISEEEKEDKPGLLVEQKAVFECICGRKDQESDGRGGEMMVACVKCGLKQHAACMKYDLTDPYRGDYMCPHCHAISTPKPSGATLIISPHSISTQWVEEIRKHIHKERLKVLVYNGVHVHGYIQPQFLASHDIVITTYEMLQKEINYVDLPHSNSEAGRRFRHPKRFMAVPSPIVAVEWWRICLDEAQMVECTTTKSAEMALRLSAINRWCVTGTPIQKGLNDLYGLLLFLGEAPYWVQPWWERLLYTPYCHGNKTPMHDAMSNVMWRSSKADVLDQICLPTQCEEVHWLAFSPVEEHFYMRTFASCAQTGLQSLNKWDDGSVKLNSLDRYTLHALLMPLTRLRQACCHPQAVRGSYLPIQKSMMTMEEVLVSMTKKARQECEEAHRQLVAAMNGQAGLHIIKNKYEEAVNLYRDVLRSIEEQKHEFRTDPLQQLHTLHNLQEVLSLKPAGVHPTLRDDKLQQEAADLRAKYLLKAASFVTAAQEAWAPLRTAVRDARKEMGGHDDWWADLLQWVLYMGTDELLVERIRNDLFENRQMNNTTLASSFRDIRGLEYVLQGELEALSVAHLALIERVTNLQCEPTPDIISETVECCLRPVNPEKPLKTCIYCRTHELFEILENKLFSFKDKGVSMVSGLEGESSFQVGTRRQGTWADSEMERILKTIINYSKSYGANPTSDRKKGEKLVDIGSAHIRVLEAMKKEFKVVRTLWIELKAQVSAHDELDMATTRLRLRLPDEPIADPPQLHILEPAEFSSQEMKLKSDIIIAENLLKRKTGQLIYLKNLSKAQTAIEGQENVEPCPICQRTLGKKWAVFTCGHSFCLDCVRLLIDQYSFGGHVSKTKCALCRQATSHQDISYVSMMGEKRDTQIKGDHSTKVEGVTRCVLEILKQDPHTKILIFSLWQNVLCIIEQALRDNNITFLSLSSKFQKNLSHFKNDPSVNVLLLPVQSGSNGLNLIEATHLLLVEPILNPGQELQAVGRIHRIGQTRPTFVHRFLVRNTIEERLHHLLAVRGTSMTGTTNNVDDTPFTIHDLRSLFLESQEEHPDVHRYGEEEETVVIPGEEEEEEVVTPGEEEEEGEAGRDGVELEGDHTDDMNEIAGGGERGDMDESDTHGSRD